MMKVTTTLTKKGRVNVFTDGEYAFTVPCLLWRTSGIKENGEITPDELERLRNAGSAEDAYEKALRFLSYRAHTRWELDRKLAWEFPPDAVDAALRRCEENRLLDDGAFAESYAEELVRRKNFSRERIYRELLNKGVDRETADSAVKGLALDPAAGIEKALDKLHLPEAPDKKQTEKAIRRLMNLGYSYHEIVSCLKARGDGSVPEEAYD